MSQTIIINRDWIATHIPHQGRMCLLTGVVQWDEARLLATAESHTALDNPLRANGRLGAVNGIEYAAQAMAVHAALLGATPRAGFLASVRSVCLHVVRLDDVAAALHIHVHRLHGDHYGLLYQFNVQSGSGQALLDGRAAISHREHG